MKIHEYQAKSLLAKFGLPVPMGIPVLEKGKASAAAEKIIQATQNQTVVVKAQIHAGGRGKGGGVKVSTACARPRPRSSDIPWLRIRPDLTAGWSIGC
jgi:succinyl-CoA synthetase beta subunit